jgi:integrase
MYRALADIEQAGAQNDMMPALIADWMLEVSTQHKPKTQANDIYQTRTIGEAFAEFRASEVSTPDVVDFLKNFKSMARTHNAYRSMMRELMRYAEEKGYRKPNTNPVDSLKTMKTPPRSRYITDSELRRIKVGICYGDNGLRTPSGPMICCLVEMAYLTGQRASDLLNMEWTEITNKGILFQPGKTLSSTAVSILVGLTPRLERLIRRLKQFPQSNMKHVFCKLDGQRYTYSGANTAWKRGLKRAGMVNTQFRDLRAKALTDLDESDGIQAAQRLGGHSTQSQTAEYIRHKRAINAKASK